MGIMDLLFNFALQCFHILAWPLLAFGYPLCASIQAIEANSYSDTRKLITYWICLSLILLLDPAFRWLPYWPYTKLIIVGFLVIPCFNGSFYIYNHLVEFILSVNPHVVFNWFIKMFEMILKEDDDPLTKMKREAKETEPQAMQDLIASKGTVERPKVELKDNIGKEIKETNDSATDSVTQTGGRDLYNFISCNKKPQNEWTCVVCQVTTTSEEDFISHLQGKRHADEFNKVKPKEQPLETNLLVANSTQGPAETQDSKIRETLWPCVLCKVTCRRKLDLILHFQGQRHAKALEGLKARPNAKYYFKPWKCEICNAQLENKNNLISHFDSKRHWTACEIQKLETKTSVVLDEASSVSFENSTLTSKEQKEAINLKTGSYLEILMQPTS